MLQDDSETDAYLSSPSSTKDKQSAIKKHKKSKKTSEKKNKIRKEDKNRRRLKKKSYPKDLGRKKSNDMHLLAHGNNSSNEVDMSQASYGPALPPNLIHNKITSTQVIPVKPSEHSNEQFIGPVMPISEKKDNDVTISAIDCMEMQENLVDCYGPLPFKENGEFSATQAQLEERALQLKITTIDSCLPSCSITQKEREEWMIELPEVRLKDGLAALRTNQRYFYQGKNKPDLSDRSCWTKTPNDNASKQKTEKANKAHWEKNAQEIYDKQRDTEQKALARKHILKESLVEIHQRKLRKELERKSKKMKILNEKPTRRPFTRDVDLKLNKIDSNQTRSIIAKSKMLNTKFACGQKQYL